MGTSPDSLLERSDRVNLDGVEFSAFVDRPLDESTLRCLRYMHDIECHTICYLREILATRAHRDTAVTDFLSCWGYEEHWHGAALARVLKVHGDEGTRDRVAALRYRLVKRNAVRPLLFGLGSEMTPHVVTIQMAWGAVNERTTHAGYARLAAQANHPALSELLRRIMKQEGRHVDFYTAQARARLAGSRSAQRLTRLALHRFWTPVGSDLMPKSEVEFLSSYLFGDEAGLVAARRVDRGIDTLPGLSGLRLLERAATATA